jgi:hypothetical protein
LRDVLSRWTRVDDLDTFTWERIDKVTALKKAVK